MTQGRECSHLLPAYIAYIDEDHSLNTNLAPFLKCPYCTPVSLYIHEVLLADHKEEKLLLFGPGFYDGGPSCMYIEM
jgi:hypothetical protein